MTGDPADNDDTLLNIRLPENCSSKTFRQAYTQHVFPYLNNFKPEILMISAGFDAHIDDPLANTHLKDEDYGWIGENLHKIAQKNCKNRIISTLEGGYNVKSLVKCIQSYLTGCLS
jgi:acetoin utilization deacetylase AcuC-like enzyme